MKPYYQDEWVTIYHGDCREILPQCNFSPDLIILDPPFDMWGNIKRFEAETVLCFTNYQNRIAVERIYGKPRFELIWHFTDGRWVSNKLPQINHESILLYGKSGSSYVGEAIVDRRPIKKGRAQIGSDKNLGERIYRPRERKMLTSVVTIPRNMRNPMGCFGKPVKLMNVLIEWINPHIILDPYAGGGSSLLACKLLNMRCVGIEIEEKYCEIAAKRCSQGVFDFSET